MKIWNNNITVIYHNYKTYNYVQFLPRYFKSYYVYYEYILMKK